MSIIPGQRWWTVEFGEDGTVIDLGAVLGAAGLDGLTGEGWVEPWVDGGAAGKRGCGFARGHRRPTSIEERSR